MPDTGSVPAAAVVTVEPPCIGFPLSSAGYFVEKYNQ
jgi:hypothetical protein